jgi:hypothetical protein
VEGVYPNAIQKPPVFASLNPCGMQKLSMDAKKKFVKTWNCHLVSTRVDRNAFKTLTARLIPSSRTINGKTSDDITKAAGPSPMEKN